MAHAILTSITASISELKKNPMATVAAGAGFPVAMAYEALMDKLEDAELNALADARLKDGKCPVKVKLGEL